MKSGPVLIRVCLLWAVVGPALGQDPLQEEVLTGQQRSIEARRTSQKIVVDGELDEPAWSTADPASDFIQSEPQFGQPASERTEVRLLYDDENLYVGAYCYDSGGRAAIVVNDMRQDFSTRDSDVFEIVLDTFNDDRSGFLFGTNPEGARFDGQFGNEGRSFNRDWDAIWYTRARRTDNGWQLEMAIPFRTLRFSRAETQVWGVNFLRRIRRKREDSYWAPIPPPFRVTKVSLAGNLLGIQGVRQGRNLYVKPYVVGPVSRLEGDDVDFKPDTGLDVKYGLSSQLTLDLTFNTDFSQVEDDEQQVNLTRFSLFFPEKREFFLENSSIFEFGRDRRGGNSGRGRPPDLVPFFSRRIGISEGGLVPILGGARVTGRVGKYNIGVLSMQSDEVEDTASTNFAVIRVRRDVFSRSDMGMLLINKQGLDGSWNRTYGFDSNFTFFDYLNVSAYALQTATRDEDGDEAAARAAVEWDDDVFRIQASHLRIGDDFNPEVGFVRRRGIQKTTGQFEWTPRPGERVRAIRKLGPSIRTDYITNREGKLETRQVDAGFEIEFQNGSRLSLGQEFKFERLDEPFEIREDQFIAAGDYNFNEFSAFYSSDRSRTISGDVRIARGGFFDGDRDAYSTGLRIQPNYRFNVDLSWRHNDLKLPSGDFSTDLVSSRVAYAFSTDMFLNALIQYNSTTGEITSNIRYNFIYKPLSDLFVVYNERRARSGEILDRALILKLTYVLSF